MERLINKAELSQNRVWTAINFQMSSLFYNLLDNFIIFAKAIYL